MSMKVIWKLRAERLKAWLTERVPAGFAATHRTLSRLMFGEPSPSVVTSMRRTVLLWTGLVICVGAVIVLAGLAGPQDPFYKWMNLAYLLVSASCLAARARRKAGTTVCLSVLLGVSMAEVCGEMFWCMMHPSLYHTALMLGNTSLALLVVLLATHAYLGMVSALLSVAFVSMYVAAAVATGSPSMLNFLPVFALCFVLTLLLGWVKHAELKRLIEEKTLLRAEVNSLLVYLRKTRQSLGKLIDIGRGVSPDAEADIDKLMTELTPEHQAALFGHMRRYYYARLNRENTLAGVFPDLTRAEIDIVAMILQERTLSEMVKITGKTPSTITSMRSHIRQKLGVGDKENLNKHVRNIARKAGI